MEGGGGGGDEAERKRRRRRESNKASARRSRMRKKQRVEELLVEAERLKEENKRLAADAGEVGRRWEGVAAENGKLRAEVAGLAERLRELNEKLRFMDEYSVGGLGVEIPEIPEFMDVGPWELPGPVPAQVEMGSVDNKIPALKAQ